jgi:uncharacterized protein YbbC (DUF1343 family)
MGIDQLGSIKTNFIENKRVGLITNNWARNHEGRTSLDAVKKIGGYRKLTLLTPEHGYFGDYQSGETVESYYDNALGVQVESLYRKPDSKNSSGSLDIDREMRETDSIKDSSKFISRDVMDQFDTIIFDLQDVGCRIYTYIATMIYAMEAVERTSIYFVVLDCFLIIFNLSLVLCQFQLNILSQLENLQISSTEKYPEKMLDLK